MGSVNGSGDAFVRPDDVQILSEPETNGAEALVERIVHLGVEVRVELKLDDGRDVWTHVTREQEQQLELAEGQIRRVRLPPARVFAD
jgi:sulfate transport system ATP-binding protein